MISAAAPRLQTRLILLVLISALPAMLVIGYLLYDRHGLVADRAERWLEDYAVDHAEPINRYVSVLVDDLADVRYERNSLHPAGVGCFGWLKHANAIRRPGATHFLVDTAGRPVCGDDHDAAFTPEGGSHPVVRAAIERGGLEAGADVVGRYEGVVVIARALVDAQGPYAVVGVRIGQKALAPLLPAGLAKHAVLTLVDEHGVILARTPDPAGLIGARMVDPAVLAPPAADRRARVFAEQWLDGVGRLSAVVPVTLGRGIFVRVGVPLLEVEAAAHQALISGIVVWVGTSLSLLLLSVLVARALVLKRVRALSAMARRLAEGDLSARSSLPPDSGELGALAGVMDHMAGQLEGMVTELRHATDEVNLRNRAIDASSNGIMIYRYDRPAGIVSANPALYRMFGFSPWELVRLDLANWGKKVFGVAGWRELEALITRRSEGQVSLKLEADADVRWLEASLSLLEGIGEMGCFAVIEFRDVSERHDYEQQLERLANYDSVTGLPNRNLLRDRIEQAAVQCAGGDAASFVLWLDLDRFRMIRDAVGQPLADEVLRSVSRCLSASVARPLTIARVSGCAFVVIADRVGDAVGAIALARALLEAVRTPFRLENEPFSLTASIGIATLDASGNVEGVLGQAKSAMSRARAEGGDGYRFYDEGADLNAHRRMRLEMDLRGAIERDELFLEYQPKVDLLTGEIFSVEALCRWQHPEHGRVPPSEFIPLAESGGLIKPIGSWVLRTAIEQMRMLRDAGTPCPTMAVNLSMLQFFGDDLCGEVSALLESHGVAPDDVIFEITESTVMADPAKAIETMHRMKDLGLKLAIDDFGTGFSSLSALKRVPADYLKIDRAFVAELPACANDAAIVVSIISLAHSLGLRVIAEGVETESQMLYLRGHGCDAMQGYYYARPMVGKDLKAMMSKDARLRFARHRDLPERTLLLVDDEPRIQSALRRMLRREGYSLVFADNAEQALEIMARQPVGVVISDMRMPGMSGAELLAHVHKRYPAVVCMLLSGMPNLSLDSSVFAGVPVFRVLHKPWEDREVVESLREAFDAFELRLLEKVA